MGQDPSPSLDECLAHAASGIAAGSGTRSHLGAGSRGTGTNCPGREGAGAGAGLAGLDHEGSEAVPVASGSSAS